MSLERLLAAGLLSALVAGVATPLAAALARRVGALDRPGGYKQHAGAVPLLGGLGVAAGFAGGLLLALPGAPSRRLTAVALGALVVLLAGLLDDLRGMTPGRKLAWQLLAAAVAGATLLLSGVRLQLFAPGAAAWMALLTVVWVVAVTNAWNLVDHAHGVCAGLAALAAAALAGANFRSGAHEVALAAACVAGAALGFLPWNWPRARVFLGDAGSMALGFTLAALAVAGVYTPGARLEPLAVAAPVVALCVPLADVAFVVALRLRAGHPPWVGDRRHVAHRLVARGVPPALATAAIWAAGAAAAAAALALPTLELPAAAAALAALAAALAVLGLGSRPHAR